MTVGKVERAFPAALAAAIATGSGVVYLTALGADVAILAPSLAAVAALTATFAAVIGLEMEAEP